MKMRAVILLLLGLILGRAGAAPAEPEAVMVVLGDQHSAYDKTAQLVGFVDQLRATHPDLPMAILLDGDTQEYGNMIAQRSAGAIDFAMYAALAQRAPTVVNLGNHESEFMMLDEVVARIEQTGAKVVSNLVNRATGKSFAPASVHVSLGGREALVVGIGTDVLAYYRVAVRPTLDPVPTVKWARENLPAMFAREPLAIVLSHAGIAMDRQLLPLVPDGTLFVGAHDHQRFVEPFGRTVYFHSGSWNSHVSLAWLTHGADGEVRWSVEQVELTPGGPADPAMQATIAKVMAEHLTDADRAVVGRTAAALAPPEAGRAVAAALRQAAGVDAAFIGNTTFGAGLPAGDVTRLQFDACVRFDGAIFTAEVDGARLAQLLAAANLTPETPFAQRRGEFCFAAGPASIDPARTYRIATTDWGAKNTERYFGAPAIAWREQPGLKLKAAALRALAAP
jgi:2',3'-cyclic-nucleotide 2'-phosphodiesterase (5'-nucleotidase family)